MISVKNNKLGLYINITIGAIFCQVNSNSLFIQFNPSITSGNQKWNGAAPVFVNIAEEKIKEILSCWGVIINCDIKTIENNKIDEARAWVMKYLIDASVAIMFFELFIKGIMESKLISKPIHMPNQVWEDTVIRVLVSKVERKSNL